MSYTDNRLRDPQQFHDFLFDLYAFAEIIEEKMHAMDNFEPTRTLPYAYMAYIEDFMDLSGRSLINTAAKEAGLDSRQSLRCAHENIDRLREHMAQMKQVPAEGAAVDEAAKRLKWNWGTRE